MRKEQKSDKTQFNLVVRGIVGLEYPPNKFHPDRRAPGRPLGAERTTNDRHLRRSRRLLNAEPLPNAQYVPAVAASNKMRRSLAAIDVQAYQGANAADIARHLHLQGDLNEEVPTAADLQRKNENVIHFDIDPNNSKQ
jgi:hypothetical protein